MIETQDKNSRFKIVFQLLKNTFTRWIDDNAPSMGASLSYYTAFSLAPLLLLAIAIAGLIFGRDAAQGKIMEQLNSFMGRTSAEAIQSMIQAAQRPAAGTWATLISFLTLLLGASGVMNELQNALNKIWRVKSPPGFGAMIRGKLLSFGMVLGIGFLLLVSLVLSSLLAAVGSFFGNLLPIPEFLLHGLDFLASFSVITLLFAALFKLLPDAAVKWRDVWTGAALTSLLFVIGKFFLGIYLGKETVGSSYGAAGSVLVILLWIYYSAQILYFGAEFTKVYSEESST